MTLNDQTWSELQSFDRIYAIGDIHGRADLLEDMAGFIADDLKRDRAARAVTVFLGDYIDRGPASSAVIERLVRQRFPTSIVTLRGNHEQMLLDGLHDQGTFESWLWNGGNATMRSYADNGGMRIDNREFFTIETFKALLPPTHLEFFRHTRMGLIGADYFFCHAGVRPGVPLGAQDPHDLLWIRHPFHVSNRDFGKVVVHGHTPVDKPELLPNRINVDTGAFKTGILTCVVLDGGRPRFFSTRAK